MQRRRQDRSWAPRSTGQVVPTRRAVEALVEWTAPVRAELGIEAEIPEQNGAQRARASLEAGASLRPNEFQAWAAARLPRYMVPRYLRITTLPLTASERVQRRQLRTAGVTADTLDLADARGVTVNRD